MGSTYLTNAKQQLQKLDFVLAELLSDLREFEADLEQLKSINKSEINATLLQQEESYLRSAVEAIQNEIELKKKEMADFREKNRIVSIPEHEKFANTIIHPHKKHPWYSQFQELHHNLHQLKKDYLHSIEHNNFENAKEIKEEIFKTKSKIKNIKNEISITYFSANPHTDKKAILIEAIETEESMGLNPPHIRSLITELHLRLENWKNLKKASHSEAGGANDDQR